MAHETRLDKRLNDILGVSDSGGGSLEEQLDSLDDENLPREPFEVVKYEPKASFVDDSEISLNQDALDDYKHSRSVLYGLLERGQSALEGALMLAKESEHPRAFEVASNLINNVSQLTKDLLALQKALNPTAGRVIKAETVNVQNNTTNKNTTLVMNSKEQTDKDELFGLLDDLDDQEGETVDGS